MRFVFVHSTGGNPEEVFFPWLKGALEKDGHSVLIPAFPTPEGQTLENWMEKFPRLLDDIKSVL